MKRIFISGLILLLATATVQAQSDTSKTSHQRHGMHKGGAYKQLALSADQQAKIKSLNDTFRTQWDALKTQQLTEAERKTSIKALHQQHKTAVEAILTPAQKAELAQLKSKRTERMGKKSVQGEASSAKGGKNWKTHDGKRGTALHKELNLTTEQQAKMKEIRTGFKAKAETLRNDAALTQEQKREKLHALKQQKQEQIKTVLTKEQQEKMQSLRQERAARTTR